MATQQLIVLGGGAGSDTLETALTKVNTNLGPLFTHLTDPTNPHATTAAQVGAIALTDVGVALGVASLDANGVLVKAQIPEIPYSALTQAPTTLAGFGITDAVPNNGILDCGTY